MTARRHPAFTALIAPLFVPATRPERILKAAQSGADAVIVDLEDAVAPQDKEDARAGLHGDITKLPVPAFLRVNAVDSEWFADDIAFARKAGFAGVMLPKTETAPDILSVGADMPVIGLIETARGILGLDQLCTAPNLCQLAFGSIDYALDVSCAEERDSLLLARLAIVTHARAHELPPPIDGVSVSINDVAQITSDAEYAVRLGFGGKLAIHPKQIAPIYKVMQPSEQDVAWAQKVCAADATQDGSAQMVDGMMIDAPVVKRARRILERALNVSV